MYANFRSPSELAPAASLLGVENCRGLAEKSLERRRAAAQAVQTLVKEEISRARNSNPAPHKREGCAEEDFRETSTSGGDERVHSKISQIVSALIMTFLNSPLQHMRKGGLLGIAAVGLALEDGEMDLCLPLLLRPLLKAFGDPDPRVRYYACESLFNVLSGAREKCLPYLIDLFDGLCKLCGDVDSMVRQGVCIVDNLLKEEASAAGSTSAATVVTENEKLEETGPITSSFVRLLAERLQVRNPYIKLLAISWISLLESNASIDMLQHLPLFLGSLLELLGDSNRDIRQAADLCVTSFLEDLRSDPIETDSAVVAEISEVILRYINPNSDGTSTSSFSQLTALVWLHELLLLLLPDASPHQKSRASDECPTDSGAGGSISERRDASRKLKWREDAQKHLKGYVCALCFRVQPNAWRMMQSILRSASEGEEEIARVALEIHAHVIARVRTTSATLDLTCFVSSAVRYLMTYTSHANESGEGGTAPVADVRMLCLEWMEMLLVERPTIFSYPTHHSESEEVDHDLLVDKTNDIRSMQRPLVAAVAYTALTADANSSASSVEPTSANNVLSHASSNEPLLLLSTSVIQRFVRNSTANLRMVTEELLLLFRAHKRLLDTRGRFLIRHLCGMGSASEVFIHMAARIREIAETAFCTELQTGSDSRVHSGLIQTDKEGQDLASSSQKPVNSSEISSAFHVEAASLLEFVQHVVQVLGITLLTAAEARPVREELRRDHKKELFYALLPTWAEEDSLQPLDLLQLEQLTLLIENQHFAFIRIMLLHQPPNVHLLNCLRGIAMLLPSGSASNMLQRRLQIATSTCHCSALTNSRAKHAHFVFSQQCELSPELNDTLQLVKNSRNRQLRCQRILECNISQEGQMTLASTEITLGMQQLISRRLRSIGPENGADATEQKGNCADSSETQQL